MLHDFLVFKTINNGNAKLFSNYCNIYRCIIFNASFVISNNE